MFALSPAVKGSLLRLLGCCQRSCKPICRSPAVPGVWRTSLPLGLRCLLEPASAVPPLAEGCHEAWQEDVDRHNEGKPDALQEAGCWGLWLRWRMRPVPNWAPLGVFIKLDPGSLGYDMGMGLKTPAESTNLDQASSVIKHRCTRERTEMQEAFSQNCLTRLVHA